MKFKIIIAIALLLSVLLISLTVIYREVERLAYTENEGMVWADSLINLLREKDENTIAMLRTLNRANDASMITSSDIEQIIATQDTVVTIQRVQHRIIEHRDTLVTPSAEKKGFFRRLKEAFVPPKNDSIVRVKTSLEYATDTVLDTEFNPTDSLHEKLRAVAKEEQERRTIVKRRNRTLQRMDRMLSGRIDSLLKGHEQETLEQARADAEYRQHVRSRSARTIGGIAIGAVLLAAVFLVLIVRDVTRSNRYRRELEEANRRAEDLLATREKLMLAITHDFKAPLGSIIGYADLLSRLTVDERQRFYLDNMRTSSEHLLKLVTDLLDFHRLDLHKVEVQQVPFNPARMLEEICVSFRPLTDAKGLKLVCEIDPALRGAYRSDPLRLRQIVGNLLSNAIKFTDSGSITLEAGYHGHTLRVSVKDTGKGMDPADRERIFREFTRLPDAQGKEGFGLGLSIVRMLVQLLDGMIQVDSTPGKGSIFTVRLPLLPSETPDAEEVPSASPSVLPASVSLQKVLIIDDDRIQLSLTKALLAQSDIQSVCCLQVDELLDALRTDRFDVLLTDVQMPAINGFDLLQLLRSSNIEQARTIPILAVTARSDMSRDDFVAHGFAGCLHKPYTLTELLDELGGGHTDATAASSPSPSPAAGAGTYNLSALTAFSGDDVEAARSIMESFVSETKLNLERLQKAVSSGDAAECSAVAHKMIPLFTLIGAEEVVRQLRHLEAARDLPFTDESVAAAREVIGEIGKIAEEAASELSKMDT